MTTGTLRIGTPVVVTRSWGGRSFPPVGATGVVIARWPCGLRRVRMDGEACDVWMFNSGCLRPA